jgi:molybdenum cofactor biosynthesis enzyme MoaA
MNVRWPGIGKLFVEVTNYCNFRCDFCPIALSARKPQHMALKRYQSLIDEVAAHHISNTICYHVLR